MLASNVDDGHLEDNLSYFDSLKSVQKEKNGDGSCAFFDVPEEIFCVVNLL